MGFGVEASIEGCRSVDVNYDSDSGRAVNPPSYSNDSPSGRDDSRDPLQGLNN